MLGSALTLAELTKSDGGMTPNSVTLTCHGLSIRQVRIIYCDFDGVLHPVSALAVFEMRLPREAAVQQGRLFRWTYILEELLTEHKDVKIVVHSSWRQLLPDQELRRYLGPLGDRYIGKTDNGDRWQSILNHVKTSNPGDWIVLDDHAGEFPTPQPLQLVLCDPESGVWDPVIREKITAWLQATAER
ncbi:HAD domain-containing protein [Castellaniella sp. GW247-6E4]|uniref:HAD domain-containing protein n=1 Tax=Castellaniella sp. GW247-6E4 TaxID=3140380 RepID=UPI00331618C9